MLFLEDYQESSTYISRYKYVIYTEKGVYLYGKKKSVPRKQKGKIKGKYLIDCLLPYANIFSVETFQLVYKWNRFN